MFMWEIEDSESQKLIKWAREKYLKCLIDKEAAEEGYYEIVSSVIGKKLLEKRIVPGMTTEINFADGTCKCIYEGLRRGKIYYRPFTKKGKPYKSCDNTSWDMWEHITRIEEKGD